MGESQARAVLVYLISLRAFSHQCCTFFPRDTICVVVSLSKIYDVDTNPQGLRRPQVPDAQLLCSCRENAKAKDVRVSNIEAAKAVADAVRTSLGPRGMDKMVSSCMPLLVRPSDSCVLPNASL